MLSNPKYVREQIREISDADLWSSLDLSRAGLEAVRSHVDAGTYNDAAAAWGSYWSAKRQPLYVTLTDHLMLDTDLLMGLGEFRIAMERSPEEGDSLLARAGMILHNAFIPWGDSVIRFGDTVDFNREIGQSGKYGFHYWFWSRPLIMSAVLTGDQKYQAKFDQLFNWWYEQRNSIMGFYPELNVVYYELGLGTRNRMFIENYMLPYRDRTTETHRRMMKTMLAAGRWLYQLERWEGYRPGNWQIHGSYMLTQIALVFPEFREAGEWLRMGLQRMSEHLESDFFPDGGHSERCPRNYTMATYLGFRNLAYLLEAYGVRKDLSEKIRASMGRTIDWWLTMLTPTGEIPAINDSHRGLFPTVILRDGAEFFHKPQAYPVMRQLLGTAVGGVDSLPSYTSRHMPASGFTVMRTDWSPDALYLSMNYGPAAGFHTHFDMLDFECYAYGKPLAVDAGLGLTYDDPLYQSWYRSSRAHNMVVVNDSNIVREGTEGKNVQWGSTQTVDYFAASHSGYDRFGVRQRRHIVFVKPSYWFMLDELSTAVSEDTLSWYLHSPQRLTPNRNGFVSEGDTGISILPAGQEFTTRTGTGWAASTTVRKPGKTEEIGWIRFDQVSVRGSIRRFAILLEPFRDKSTLRSADRVSDRHYVVTSPGQTDHLYITGGAYADDTLQTDGACAVIRIPDAGVARFTVINGRYLTYRGQMLWNSLEPASGEGEFTPQDMGEK
ncbi:MAG: alginate lyase family protein [Bacteroidota bacterium]